MNDPLPRLDADERPDRLSDGRRSLLGGPGRVIDRRAVRAYSRRVRSLRVLLPVAALMLAAAVLLWPSVGPEENRVRLSPGQIPVATAIPPEGDVLRMVQPRFISTDPENRPFTLTADLATQPRMDDSTVTLSAPKADLTDQAGAWMQLSADAGVFDRRGETLTLTGGVTLFHDSGMELHSDEVAADLKARHIDSTSPVYGQGPQGALEAKDGFRILDRGQRIELRGASRVVVRGSMP